MGEALQGCRQAYDLKDLDGDTLRYEVVEAIPNLDRVIIISGMRLIIRGTN
jgi:hypothetical protein